MTDAVSWESILSRGMSIYAVAIVAIMWVGFAFLMVIDQTVLGQIWDWVKALPLALEIAIWIVFLPIMVLLWIWQSTWPVILKVLGFVSLGGWTLTAISSLVKAFK